MRRALALAAATALILLFVALSAWEMSGDSLTADERVHLPAGYAYWKIGEFRLNPEHPPFVKLLAALPLLPLDPRLPWPDPPAGTSWHRHQADFGWTFFFTQDADRLLFRGRLPILLLGVLLAATVFRWSWRLHGHAGAGLVALALVALEPTIVAHSHYVTTDVAVAAFVVLAFAALWSRHHDGGGRAALAVAVLSMGLALASKFSALVLLPVFVLLWAAPGAASAARAGRPTAARRAAEIAVALVVMATVVQACYFFSPDLGLYLRGLRAVQANHPADYPAYVNGRFVIGGAWWYAPWAWLLKTPVATIAVIGAGTIAAARARAGAGAPAGAPPPRGLRFVIAPAAAYAAAVCAFADNYGVRYLIPVTAFLIVLGGGAFFLFARRGRIGVAAATVLAAWLALSVGCVAPHHIAYFNEIAGGPARAARLMNDSNLDWGQDVKRLARFAAEKGIRRWTVACWGPNPPEHYGITGYFPWNADVARRPMPPPGLYALSVNQLVDMKKQVLLEGDDPNLDWLARFEPVDRVGYSIYIFRFPR